MMHISILYIIIILLVYIHCFFFCTFINKYWVHLFKRLLRNINNFSFNIDLTFTDSYLDKLCCDLFYDILMISYILDKISYMSLWNKS